jgi:hypothetical protein
MSPEPITNHHVTGNMKASSTQIYFFQKNKDRVVWIKENPGRERKRENYFVTLRKIN